ncbi:UNVERIFIED_CONTAM: Phosphatidylinositol 4-kinase alpha 1 [Sesamum calycinum]|uniref:1-phosphatidylinositol 4-kinase n=1 Tax=Sesamum calycinum TaxID=2727403 RepID=A0AAW2J5Z7_9LAMI
MVSATAKCNHAGEIAGMRRLYESIGGLSTGGLSLDLPFLGSSAQPPQPKNESFNEILLCKFVRLLQKFVNIAEKGEEVDKKLFRETCSQATALLLSNLDSDPKSNIESFSQLLRLLCWCPAYITTPDAMETGVYIWTWLVSAAPQLGSLVLAELVDAWLWTIDTKRGLFASDIRCAGPSAKLRPHLAPGEPEPQPEKDPVEQIMAHRLWLGFIIDRFEVVRHDSVEQLLLLGRMLQGTTKLPWKFFTASSCSGNFLHFYAFWPKIFARVEHKGTFTAGLQLLEEIYIEDRDKKNMKKELLFTGDWLLQTDQYHPVWGQMGNYASGREKRRQLLLMLCQHEADRLESHILEIRAIPEALPYFVTPKAVDENSTSLQQLPHWAACSITQALEFLTPAYKGHPRVMAYVLRVLESYPPERVTFFMPQLVQALRYDDEGETCVPESGKDAASITNNSFQALLPVVRQRIVDGFNPKAFDVFQREFDFFDKVTSISGVLFPLPKEERRAGIRRELENIQVEGDDLYLPTAPNKLVRGIQVDSGIPLQSAAKVPIMITFNVVDRDGDPKDIKPQACIFKVRKHISGQMTIYISSLPEGGDKTPIYFCFMPELLNRKLVQVQASTALVSALPGIEKVGDDCRQDVLALQVISLLKDIFEAVGLNLYLFPYGVLPTGPERGIIEVVPNSRSRSQMGETTDGGLYEIFQQDFGPVGSPSFEAARENFLISSAGYAVASLLLQPKDRHNGNLLFDNVGRLVHIDFGFILETSPGGNMRFESAHFKLSHEMTQLLDPSGVMKSDTWYQFVSLCVKGYLAARRHMDGIINTVLLMMDSGLPCFSRGDPIGNLRKRFHPEMSEREAANFMIRTCTDAYNKWTTAGYDLIQYLQQGIEK